MKESIITILILINLLALNQSDSYCQEVDSKQSLSFWIVGSFKEVKERFGEDFSSYMNKINENKETADLIFLKLAQKPLNKKELFMYCNLPKDQFDEMISLILKSGLISYNKEDQYVTNIPVITDSQMKILKADMEPAAKKVAEFLKQQIPLIQKEYENSVGTEKPPWEIMSHLFIDNFIIDNTFRTSLDKLEESNNLRDQYYNEKQQIITSFLLEQGKNFATFGTNIYSFGVNTDKKRDVIVSHGGVIGRYGISVNKYQHDNSFDAFLQSLPENKDLSKVNEQEELILNELKWIDGDSLIIPIIDGEIIKLMMPLINEIGLKTAEVFFNEFDVVLDSFNESPYSNFLTGLGDYIQVCYHVLFGSIIEQLLNMGALAPIPQPLPESFGVFITIGSIF